MAQLDTFFNHYLTAVLRTSAVLPDTNGRWRANVTWLGDIVATAPTRGEATALLREYLTDRVFARMRTRLTLPVIDGIDLNGGSC